MSKFSLDVLRRCVFPFVGGDDPDILLGSAFGEDVALTAVGDDILASHVDPIVGAIGNIGWLAVHVASNDIAASGIPPRWLLMLVLVPDQKQEDLLQQIMRDAHQAAGEIGASIIGGHTGYSAGISRPLVAVTALGTAAGRTPVRTGGARIGDHVLVTKGIALEGTGILAQDFEDIALRNGLTENELQDAKQLMQQVSVLPEAIVLADMGVSAMHDVTRGGLLETLLEISYLSEVGIDLHVDRLPIPEIVVRFSDTFKYDPLRMISSGTLAATVPPERKDVVHKALNEIGKPFAFVGRVTEGKGVYVHRSGTVTHYTEVRAEDDELARLWALHPRRN